LHVAIINYFTMKKWIQKFLPVLLAFGFILACNGPLVEDEFTSDDLELKSAQSNKTGYIVLLNDPEANQELSFVKGYEKRNEVMQKVSARILKRAGILDGDVEFVYTTALQGFSVKIPPGQLKKLENDPSVIKVSEDQIVTLIEPHTKPGEDIQATAAQTTPWGITRVNGGLNYTGKNVAWIIDTGIDLDHPDLNVDGSRGAVFVRASSPNDDNGHGSHVAGTIAAKNNSEGVIGVAAGATVIPVKVLDRRGSGSMSGVLAGVDFVATNGGSGDVANMSLGGSYYEDLNAAVQNAAAEGILFSLAAGNESTDAGTRSPASAEGTNIYTISAMDSNDNFASFSNYGNPPVDYCEPGVSIYSTYKDGSYKTLSGTSMAAPHMAGILLLKGNNFPTDGTVNGDPDGKADLIAVVSGSTENQAPVADAGPDQIVTDSDGTGSESVTLNGSGSADDVGIESYVWSESGTTIATGVNPTVSLSVGTHNITLTVTDAGDLTDTDEVVIAVNENSTNQSPVANAGPDQIVTDSDGTGSESVTLNGSGSTDDVGIESYVWSESGTTIATGVNPTVSLSVGTHNITLTVTDAGDLTDTDEVVITVNEISASNPPVINVFDVVSTSNPAWKRVSVSWSVSDTDGDLKSVKTTLYLGTTEIATATTAVSGSSASGTNELGKKGGSSGLYTVIITVKDAAGNATTKEKTIEL
jgi:subtilisin family serine protease